MNWLLTLQQAGLPAIKAYEETTEDGTIQVQASFSRSLTAVEWQLFLSLTNPARARRENAINEAALATELKSLTPAQAVQYIENNVIDLPSAKRVLKVMARILIALRDETWPNLPER
jgi:hypothetical protein